MTHKREDILGKNDSNVVRLFFLKITKKLGKGHQECELHLKLVVFYKLS